ncbi:MAG: hypothetical protein M3O28_07975 [Actinomycetota bacterium]|nr:hypothetical protein [Actinomycetota bacterium]
MPVSGAKNEGTTTYRVGTGHGVFVLAFFRTDPSDRPRMLPNDGRVVPSFIVQA